MQKDLPIRKRTRLKEYDYSQAGSYFVTLCIEDRSNLLGNIIVGSGFSGGLPSANWCVAPLSHSESADPTACRAINFRH